MCGSKRFNEVECRLLKTVNTYNSLESELFQWPQLMQNSQHAMPTNSAPEQLDISQVSAVISSDNTTAIVDMDAAVTDIGNRFSYIEDDEQHLLQCVHASYSSLKSKLGCCLGFV